ncbi:hypothetical protein ALC57_05998 [Trachymyrmex cornetzi]|uniref:Uncharacterized protein n=1 Tax=Trachymyrmex cornetzi TaxID=471704 RepID=A0A151J9G4_9HYME|nr:hypothetical protein ALC57_05998 [Trachymyrmex cornetzi]
MNAGNTKTSLHESPAILLSASRRLPLYPKPSARFRGLHNLLFPSNLPNPVVPSSDWSSMPDCGSSEMTNCLAKQNEMQNFENTWIKVSVCPDYIP